MKNWRFSTTIYFALFRKRYKIRP